MNAKILNAVLITFVLSLGGSVAWSAQALQPPFPANATFTTRATTPLAIEGLTMDATGNFYTTGRQPEASKKCPVWRIGPSGSRVSVGFIPNSPACNPSGIAFDGVGSASGATKERRRTTRSAIEPRGPRDRRSAGWQAWGRYGSPCGPCRSS